MHHLENSVPLDYILRVRHKFDRNRIGKVLHRHPRYREIVVVRWKLSEGRTLTLNTLISDCVFLVPARTEPMTLDQLARVHGFDSLFSFAVHKQAWMEGKSRQWPES